MLYMEIIAVCSHIHTEHINTLSGQNVEFFNIKPGGTHRNHWTLRDSESYHVCRRRSGACRGPPPPCTSNWHCRPSCTSIRWKSVGIHLIPDPDAFLIPGTHMLTL